MEWFFCCCLHTHTKPGPTRYSWNTPTHTHNLTPPDIVEKDGVIFCCCFWCTIQHAGPGLESMPPALDCGVLTRCPIHHRRLECKSRKSRDTWSNRQVWLWSTKWSRAKANRILPREHTGHIKHLFSTTLETTLHVDITKWSVQIDCIICSWRWKSCIQSAKTRPGADCGSCCQLLAAKFRLKLKKVGKTISLVRYNLNQIPYEYTVKVRNRFKGLNLVNRVPEDVWTEVQNIVQEAANKTSQRKQMQEGNMVLWGYFTNNWGRKGRKGKVHQT